FTLCCSSHDAQMVTCPIASLPTRHDSIFFFIAAATTEIYTLSLHDALPISVHPSCPSTAHPGRSAHPVGNEPEGRLFRLKAPAKDRKSTRLNSSHVKISYAVFCLKKKIKEKVLSTEA